MQNPVTMPSAPQLGTPVPGTTGGLPALSGLSVTQNPMAQQLQSYGRGDDSMLVHMTPNEVNSLQGLAMAAGGSLTINPVTGLPEAGFLKKLLPMLAGIGLNFAIPGLGIAIKGLSTAAQAGLMTAAASTAITGNLQKGLMAGLGAFGGASLAGGIEGAISGAAKTGATAGATTGATTGAIPVGGELSGTLIPQVAGAANTAGQTLGQAAVNFGQQAAQQVGQQAAQQVGQQVATNAVKTGLPGFFQGFGNTAKGTMTGLAGKAAVPMAMMGTLNTLSEATAPKMPTYDPDAEDDFEYVPMGPGKREVRFQSPDEMRRTGGAEFQYFTPTNPEPVPLYGQQRGYAEGGVASIPTEGFEDLVSFFSSTNPGAITASMYPTSPGAAAPGVAAPASGGERVYNFARPAANATANNLGIGDGMGPYGTYGGFNISDLNGLDINAIMENLGYNRQQPAMGGTGANQQPVMPSIPVTEPNFGNRLVMDRLDAYGELEPQFEPAPTPMLPAPVSSAPAPAPAEVFDYGFDFGEILRDQNAATPAAAPVAPAPSVQPSPSAPPIMTAEPQNSPMPTYVSLEDIMASYTPQPVLSAPEPEFVPIRSGGNGRFDLFNSVEEEYARGGAVNMRDGSFVVDARTVSEIGNGSSNAGIETLMKMGGRPVRGPGDGVSDSVRASIGGKQEARVARDEVIFSPEAVRRLGGGSDARGTKKLYALMDRAHKARKKAKRGQDTKVRKGLA